MSRTFISRRQTTNNLQRHKGFHGSSRNEFPLHTGYGFVALAELNRQNYNKSCSCVWNFIHFQYNKCSWRYYVDACSMVSLCSSRNLLNSNVKQINYYYYHQFIKCTLRTSMFYILSSIRLLALGSDAWIGTTLMFGSFVSGWLY